MTSTTSNTTSKPAANGPDWVVFWVVGIVLAGIFAIFVYFHDHTTGVVAFCESAVKDRMGNVQIMGDTDYGDGSVYGEFKSEQGDDMNYWCDTTGNDAGRTLDTLDIRFS